jgi:hypothetical protein
MTICPYLTRTLPKSRDDWLTHVLSITSTQETFLGRFWKREIEIGGPPANGREAALSIWSVWYRAATPSDVPSQRFGRLLSILFPRYESIHTLNSG